MQFYFFTYTEVGRRHKSGFHVLFKRDEIYLTLISITKIPLAVAISLRHLARHDVYPKCSIEDFIGYGKRRGSAHDIREGRWRVVEKSQVQGTRDGGNVAASGRIRRDGRGTKKETTIRSGDNLHYKMVNIILICEYSIAGI